jgi:hypothetical protein
MRPGSSAAIPRSRGPSGAGSAGARGPKKSCLDPWCVGTGNDDSEDEKYVGMRAMVGDPMKIPGVRFWLWVQATVR